VRFGFVHACEQNHLQLATVGGGSVVQLESGKAVTNPLDPVFVYNFVFGVRRAFDLEGAARAFRTAGRDYVHALVSPSSGRDLSDALTALGFRHTETQAYRWAPGTGTGAPGLLQLGPDGHEQFLETYHSAWGVTDTSPRDEVMRRRLADPRTRAYRSADGNGVFLLFSAGSSTQLAHLGVAAGAQGQGLGRRMLELAPGLVSQGQPLWLFTERGGGGDRSAAAAAWQLAYTAEDLLLGLPAEPPGARASQ
jgi:GNAT superfamily N-acetyltransferase